MKTIRGFTLVELMIAVAVVGILAAVALPSYQDQVRKSRRSEAQAVLLNMAGRQQQFLLDTRAYASDATALGVAVPSSVSSAYTITFTVANSTTAPSTFSLAATPSGGQIKDKCGELTVDQAGIKAPASCW